MVRTFVRWFAALALGVAVVAFAAGCGSSNKSSSNKKNPPPAATKTGGSATFLMGTAPDFLDPSMGYTTQAAEADWISYTPLLTYNHQAGKSGEIIPGLAQALPTISKDGKTYTMTLRKGLVYSNGKAVKASDFPYSIQRAIKLNWGGKSFYTNYIVGASAFDTGKASSISGITANDSTGQITIKLTTPYGAFPNVLAFPSSSLVPTGTAMSNLSNNPPPGVGAYMITNVVPNQSFVLVKNPHFAALKIPGIPTGFLDKITVNINSNTQSEAQMVLSNQADIFDPGDTLPPALVSQIQSQASDRFAKEPIPSTFYFFLNIKKAPFNNKLAREAVQYAIDRSAMARLASGFLKPGCYFLPEGIVGHSSGSCVYGSTNGSNIAKAKALIQQAHLVGAKVTVWGEQRSPRKQYVEYYASVLNKIGFNASVKIIADATYFPTIGSASTDPQTGFADWIQDFPNPSDFYLLLDGRSIQPVNNQNFSQVNDPKIQSQLNALNPVPATQLNSVSGKWEALDKYVAQQAYVLVYGTILFPKFFSNRLNFNSAVFNSTYLNDWSTISLKK